MATDDETAPRAAGEPKPVSHPTQMHPEHSPNFQGAHGIVMMTETSKLLPWLMLTCILSGVSLGLSIVVFYVQATAYRELEREVRLQRLETDEMNVRLELANIPRHKPGDKP